MGLRTERAAASGGFRLETRKKFFTLRAVRHCGTAQGAQRGGGAPSLQIPKGRGWGCEQ